MTSTDSLAHALERISGRVAEARPRFDVEPVPLVAPGSVEQVSELLRFASRDRLRVIPFGLGSKLGWCGIPGHVDFMLSTRNLSRVVSHVPDDGTISVEAGMTMAELRRRCREGGHFLTPDAPRPECCTIGGVVAAGESGFDRLRFGPVRHHVLGTKVVLGSGTVAKSGGQLVKNVTGYDLHRLYCGSHGSLCVIVEVSLRLFPEPEHELVITTSAERDGDALERARQALALPGRTVSLTLRRDRSVGRAIAWSLHARLFGKRAPVEEERRELLRVWPSANVIEGAPARRAADEMRDRHDGGDLRGPSFHLTCSPSKAAAVLREALDALDSAGCDGETLVQPGVVEIDHFPRDAHDGRAELVAPLRRIAGAHGGSLEYRNAPRSALVGLDPSGEPAAGLDLMRAIQKKLDPDGVFATGRFHGGL